MLLERKNITKRKSRIVNHLLCDNKVKVVKDECLTLCRSITYESEIKNIIDLQR